MQFAAKRGRKVWGQSPKLSIRLYLVFLSIAIALTITSCRDPYAQKFARLNYSGEQKPAAIKISDPQLYKREALINERRDEMEYLNSLMRESRTQSFEPELIRELEAISAFSAQLGVKFDPAAAITYRRGVELGDLQQEIQTTKLQMQLAQLKRDLELLKEKLPGQTAPSAPSDDSGSNKASNPSAVTPPSTQDMSAAITRLDQLMTNVTKFLATKSEALGKTGATASPRDQFLDRQAYRSEIRDALNATSLDELHDYHGNSLYRMQFRATMLPGSELNALGVLRMRLMPPEVEDGKPDNDEVLESLYLKWLGYVTSRLNLVGSDGEIRANQALLQLGATGDYFGILEYQVPKSQNNACSKGIALGIPDATNCHIIRIALPPVTTRDLKENYRFVGSEEGSSEEVTIRSAFVEWISLIRKNLKEDNKLLLEEYFHLLPDRCETFSIEKDVWGLNFPNRKILGIAKLALESVSIGIQSIAYQSELGVLPRKDRERIISSMTDITSDLGKKLGRFLPESREFFAALRKINPRCARFLPDPEKTRRLVGGVPPDFVAALFDKSANRFKAKGRVSVYAASPIELAQKVSSVARAANALEFAAAATAVLPAKGVGASGALGYTRSVKGKVDALERVPLVIGFSEANQAGTEPSPNAGFGWLLGPKVVLNSETKELELEHHVEPYSLTADISMPGWWPYVDLSVQSAWTPNWRDNSGDILDGKKVNEKVVRVPMRHNRSDMDAITDLLVARFTGERIEIPEIERIEPEVVSICANNVTFLIRGSNIWRETKVYLSGQQGTNVMVLPDMAGIEVTFNIQNLPQRSSVVPTAQVAVWTRNGVATAEIKFTGKKKSPTECIDEGTSPAAADVGPRLEEVLPSKVYACDPELHFVVRGKNLNAIRSIFLGTLQAASHRELDPKNGTVIEVVFKQRISSKSGNLTSLPLIISTAAGIGKQNVELAFEPGCK